MADDRRRRLHALLIKAYCAADAALEFNLVVTLWISLGFRNPVFDCGC